MVENSCRAIISKDNKILLCKQSNPPRNYWTLPGGSVDVGETLVECIQREAYEELGVSIAVGQLLFIRELIADGRHRIEFLFSAEIADGLTSVNIVASNEIGSAEFFSLKDMDTIEVRPKCLHDLVKTHFDGGVLFPVYLGG